MMQPGGGSGSGSGSGSGTQMQFPASCMDAGNGAQLADGEYTLYVGGDEQKPWTAYCHSGDEFLSVADFSSYGSFGVGGWANPGTDVKTIYTKVRIDPQTLTLDIADQTFARSDGELYLSGQKITSMPLGVAMACASGSVYGLGRIDLTGTAFKMLAPSFKLTDTGLGSTPADGIAELLANGKVMESYAAGECGVEAPAAITGMPVNKLANGWHVKVEWTAQP